MLVAIALFCFNLSVFSQAISLNMNNVSVKRAMTELKAKSGYSFVYLKGDVDTEKIVKVNAVDLKDAVAQILKGQNLSFEIKDRNIVIRKSRANNNIEQKVIAVSGTVLDVNGEPVIGVNIMEKGTINGTITDMDGNFVLNLPVDATLVASFIGYQTTAVKLNGQSNIHITMSEDTKQLDEVVVVGYGTQKKSSLTASVATVPAKELNKQVSHSVASALQGRTPGVDILQKGGEAGADVKILVRGAGTFGATEPLYVIDGAFSNNGLNSLNPADIESIEILKDGSAAAIYGSRAANGVVLITTKHGKKGKTRVEISGNFALQTPSKYLDFLNADEHREYAKQIVANSTNQTQAPQNVNPTHPEINTDWQDAYLRNAPMYNLNASISGGNELSTFNTSFGYFDQKGISKFSGFKKYNARVNGTFKKGRLKVSETLSAAFTNKEPQVRMVMGIPTVPLTNAEGKYVSSYKDYYVNEATVSNPFASYASSVRRNKTVNVTGSLNIGLNLFEGLDYKLVLGGDYVSTHDMSRSLAFDSYWDENGNADPDYSRKLNSLSESRGQRFSYTIDNILTYNKTLFGHHFDAMIGTSWMREYYRTMGIGSGSTDLGGPNITIFNGKGDITSNEYNSALLSFFARLNYDYKNRYLLSASIRSDKSSKFSAGNRVGYFPSVSVGWNVHEESFFNIKWISKLKIRASYGELGANFIDPYSFLSTAYGPIPSVFGENQIGQSSVMNGYVTKFAQENLTWEKSISKNIALELGFFNNKLSLTAEYFWKDNNDLLAPLLPLASSGQTIMTNGGELPIFNSASVENKGFELTLGYRNTWNDWSLDVTANMSALRNNVKSLGEGVQPIKAEVMMSGSFNDRPTITKPGLPIGTFWGYIVEGFDDEGNFKYRDINGIENGTLTGKPDGKIDENDKTDIGNPHPDFTYGLNINVGYKNWDLTAFFQGTQGNDVFALMKYDWYFGGANSATLKDAFYNSWTPENMNAEAPKLNSKNSAGINSLPSTFYVEDGSYFRCKNLQIGYSFNKKLLKKINVEAMRIYVGVQNLFTTTKYPLYDPEVSANTLFDRGVDGYWKAQESPHEATMNSRVYNIGFNLTF